MDGFFVNVTDSLGINEKSDYENATEGATDPVGNVLDKFTNHPSILKIKKHYRHDCSFHFLKVNPNVVDIEIRALDPKKAAADKDIPSEILRTASDICLEPLTKIVNNCIEDLCFPDGLKRAGVTPLRNSG